MYYFDVLCDFKLSLSSFDIHTFRITNSMSFKTSALN